MSSTGIPFIPTIKTNNYNNSTEYTLQQVRDRLDTIIGLLASALAPGGGFKAETTIRYIVQQTELSSTWTIQSPIRYPQTSIYVTQIGNNVLPQPIEAEAQEQLIDDFTVQITFTELCKGFVVIN